MNRIGIDLGGTKIEGIVLDASGKEIFRKRIPTEQAGGYEHILNQIQYLYQQLASLSKESSSLGMGTPGSLSPVGGLMRNSNTVCLNGKPFKQDLVKKLGRDFAVENDANCFVMAEALYGAGKNKKMVFGVIMGTGCGGGIVHEGKVWQGLQSIGGEWGHMMLDANGPLCYCGKKGCVETFISGGGLEKMYHAKFGSKKSLEEIVALYRQQEPKAVSLMKDFFCHFGRALSNVINLLDPDLIVLGGGVSNIDELYTEGLQEIKKNVFSEFFITPLVKHQLGDSAGVLGAALIGI